MTNFFYYTKKNILGKNKKIFREKNSKKEYIKQNNKMVHLTTYIKTTKQKNKNNKIRGGGNFDENFDECCRSHHLDDVPDCVKELCGLDWVTVPQNLKNKCKYLHQSNEKYLEQRAILQTIEDERLQRFYSRLHQSVKEQEQQKNIPSYENFVKITNKLLELAEYYIRHEDERDKVIKETKKWQMYLLKILRNFVNKYIDTDKKKVRYEEIDPNYYTTIHNIIALNLNFIEIFNNTIYQKVQATYTDKLEKDEFIKKTDMINFEIKLVIFGSLSKERKGTIRLLKPKNQFLRKDYLYKLYKSKISLSENSGKRIMVSTKSTRLQDMYKMSGTTVWTTPNFRIQS